MPTIPLPLRPTLELFIAYADRVIVNAGRYIDLRGTLQDTEVRVRRVGTETVIVNDVSIGAEIRDMITGLSLIAGEVYYLRMRHENETGWSGWSVPMYSRVPKPITLAELSVPGEPASGGTIPIEPDFPSEVQRKRAMVQVETQTRHAWRRPTQHRDRGRVEFVWSNKTQAERDSITNFLRARIAARQSWETTTAYFGNRSWFVRAGAYEVSLVAPGVWTIRASADQVGDPA